MRKLLTSVVIFISLLSASAARVNASSVRTASASEQHVSKQRDRVTYHVRRNRITNHANRSKIVVIRFNGRKEAEFKIKKHEAVRVFGRYSKNPTILNHTQKFLTKHGIKVTYNFRNNFSRKW